MAPLATMVYIYPLVGNFPTKYVKTPQNYSFICSSSEVIKMSICMQIWKLGARLRRRFHWQKTCRRKNTENRIQLGTGYCRFYCNTSCADYLNSYGTSTARNMLFHPCFFGLNMWKNVFDHGLKALFGFILSTETRENRLRPWVKLVISGFLRFPPQDSRPEYPKKEGLGAQKLPMFMVLYAHHTSIMCILCRTNRLYI